MQEQQVNNSDINVVLSSSIEKIHLSLERLKRHLNKSDNIVKLYERVNMYIVTLEEVKAVVSNKPVLSDQDIESLSEELEEAQNVIQLSDKVLALIEGDAADNVRH